MESDTSIAKPSEITYDYVTIKITPGRLAKGLLAIPRGLASQFPKKNQDVQVYLNDSPTSQIKPYSSYNSSTHECRINSLREWFHGNNVRSGDEIVIQFIDKEQHVYRLIPESKFISVTRDLQQSLDSAQTEKKVTMKLNELAAWTQANENIVSLSEFKRLADTPLESRQFGNRRMSHLREAVPASLRTLLSRMYLGHCQVCDFWFLMRNNKPYFEVHHLHPDKGHHPKNIVVVCGNCHNQFEYSNVEQRYDSTHWLVGVIFNRKNMDVKQRLLGVSTVFSKQVFI